MQLRELQWSRAPKSKYTANSPTNRDSRKLFTDFNSVNTDQNLYSSNSNPAVTVGLAVPRSLTREGVVGPDLRVRTSVFLAWAISSLGSRLPNMYQGGRYSSKSRASYTPPCQSHEVSNAHPTLPSTKSSHNEFQDSRHNAHGTTTVRIDASQSKSTILRKFQNSFRTESEIHCRFVPSWDGCSIPVPRSPLGIINGQIDDTSTRMRTKRRICATRCHQAPPNASRGISTPAIRYVRTKTHNRLTRDLYPGLRHTNQWRTYAKHASRGSNLYPGRRPSATTAHEGLLPQPLHPKLGPILPRASAHEQSALQTL